MKLKLLSVGKVKEKNLQKICDEFSKKILYDAKLELVTIKDSNKDIESEKLMNHLIRNPGFHIALSEEGENLSSNGLALLLQSQNKPITFIIGGPNGLSPIVKSKTNLTLSLSSMTFTHEMAKVFLLEQIYRAISIIKNRKYHKV